MENEENWKFEDDKKKLDKKLEVAVAIYIKAVKGYENWNIEWINLLIKKKSRMENWISDSFIWQKWKLNRN